MKMYKRDNSPAIYKDDVLALLELMKDNDSLQFFDLTRWLFKRSHKKSLVVRTEMIKDCMLIIDTADALIKNFYNKWDDIKMLVKEKHTEPTQG